MNSLSVIICTYNPNEKIFRECLSRLLSATHQYKPYEVLIVDNNSAKPVANEGYVRDFIDAVPNTRVIVETKQGLTPARLKGIQESTGDLLVFIDDDNFIAPDFLLKGVQVADEYKQVGSFSGQVKLKFETSPAEWTKRYWGLLVHREFKGNLWSNLPHLTDTMPCGAGLFVRRKVAERYCHLHASGHRAIQLDRSGSSLFSAGDNDIAACACDIGLGVGIFDTLVVDHFIPRNRVTRDYLLKLAEGIAHSGVIFRSFRGEMPQVPTMKTKFANSLRLMMKDKVSKEFQRAVYKGEEDARRFLQTVSTTNR